MAEVGGVCCTGVVGEVLVGLRGVAWGFVELGWRVGVWVGGEGWGVGRYRGVSALFFGSNLLLPVYSRFGAVPESAQSQNWGGRRIRITVASG